MTKLFGSIAVVAFTALLPATVASAQHHHGGHGHGHGHGIDIHGSGGHHDDYGHHDHHSGWHFVVPHYDRHYHGTYYLDGGTNYYVPRPYVAEQRAYVAAKPVAIESGGFAHVDDLSGRLERLANQLCLDLHYNYRHNPDFSHVYREAYQVLGTAKYVHAKEHQGDRAEVARRLDEVDGQFHHIQEEIQRWSRRHNRQIGEGGAQTKLESVESTLHHLMNDVGVKGALGAPETVAAPSNAEEAAPAPDQEPSASDQEPSIPVSLPPPAISGVETAIG